MTVLRGCDRHSFTADAIPYHLFFRQRAGAAPQATPSTARTHRAWHHGPRNLTILSTPTLAGRARLTQNDAPKINFISFAGGTLSGPPPSGDGCPGRDVIDSRQGRGRSQRSLILDIGYCPQRVWTRLARGTSAQNHRHRSTPRR